MSPYAQFVALSATDDAFRLPDKIVTDRIFKFDLADLDPGRLVILMFKVTASGNAHLKMTFNGAPGPSIDFEFNSPSAPQEPRSWHEIVPGDIFKASGNHVLIEVPFAEEGAFIILSDLVLLYHANSVSR
jgi:hypothetical protein